MNLPKNENITREQFNELVQKNQRPLLAFAIKLCKNYANAEDLLQDALLRAWQKRHLFSPDTNFLGWAQTILLNKFRDQYESAKNKPQMVDLSHCPEIAAPEEFEDDTLPAVRNLIDHINSLPDKARFVLTRVALERVPIKRVADESGMSYRAVLSALFRARRAMKRRLADGR